MFGRLHADESWDALSVSSLIFITIAAYAIIIKISMGLLIAVMSSHFGDLTQVLADMTILGVHMLKGHMRQAR